MKATGFHWGPKSKVRSAPFPAKATGFCRKLRSLPCFSFAGKAGGVPWRYISVALVRGFPLAGVTRYPCPVEPGLSSRTGFRRVRAATESSLADIAAHYRLNVDTVMDGYFCAPSAEVTAEDAESEADAAQEIKEEIAAAEISAAPRRGVRPIMRTGLITAVAVAVVYAFAAGVLWGIVFPRAADGATVQAIVVVNVPVLTACLAAILICVSALAMITHWLLRKVLRRNKNQEG